MSMELLSPAGNVEKLAYAYAYGADAAYIGLKKFSLRVKADNFYEDEYKKCVVSELFAKEDDIFPLLGEMLKESDADTFVFNYSPTLNIFDNEEIVPDGMVKFLGNTKVNEAYIGLRNL